MVKSLKQVIAKLFDVSVFVVLILMAIFLMNTIFVYYAKEIEIPSRPPMFWDEIYDPKFFPQITLDWEFKWLITFNYFWKILDSYVDKVVGNRVFFLLKPFTNDTTRSTAWCNAYKQYGYTDLTMIRKDMIMTCMDTFNPEPEGKPPAKKKKPKQKQPEKKK